MSEIYDAAIKGDVLTLSKLLARGVDPNSSQDSITVLHISAGMWDRRMVELLINSGAKVDVADNMEEPHSTLRLRGEDYYLRKSLKNTHGNSKTQ